MYEKIINFIIAFILFGFIIFAGVQTYRVSALSESVDRYRSDLEQSRRANERYADVYREATETNTELGECLSEHVSTLSQLREQLKAIRIRYEKMQTILAELEDLCDSDDSLDDFDFGDFSGSDQCTMK